MPPAKKATRKAAAQRTPRRPAKRALSAAHKRALAEGRTLSATVDRYLAAVNTPGRRGRKVSHATLEQRLAAARVRTKSATGVDKVLAAQEVRNLQAKITQLSSAHGVDIKSLETAFTKIAKQFGDKRGVSYGAWRDAGVSAQVLKRAGITRSRS